MILKLPEIPCTVAFIRWTYLGSDEENLKSAFLNEEILKEKPESEDYILKMSRDALQRMEKSKSVRRLFTLARKCINLSIPVLVS